MAERLEADPLNETLHEDREWLLSWLIDIPDIPVTACPPLLGPVVGSQRNYSSELFVQMLFSQAVFQIRNPDAAGDAAAAFQAGVEGALRAYETILKSEPQARWEHLDELIQKRESGELEAWVADVAAQCQ